MAEVGVGGQGLQRPGAPRGYGMLTGSGKEKRKAPRVQPSVNKTGG